MYSYLRDHHSQPSLVTFSEELIQARGETLRSYSLILFGIRKNCLNSGRSVLLYQFTERAIKQTVVIILWCRCHHLRTKYSYYPIMLLSRLNPLYECVYIYIYIYTLVYIYIYIYGIPVPTAWRVLGLRMEERPPDMEVSCEYIE
jgi:hypothetical protein